MPYLIMESPLSRKQKHLSAMKQNSLDAVITSFKITNTQSIENRASDHFVLIFNISMEIITNKKWFVSKTRTLKILPLTPPSNWPQIPFKKCAKIVYSTHKDHDFPSLPNWEIKSSDELAKLYKKQMQLYNEWMITKINNAFTFNNQKLLYSLVNKLCKFN